ncbi:hypothetical protein D9758_013367 [Tetrapyrgos nigripes]|uniref:Methyltransferase n=1 Tax=Tetrapyrgos nigripes TaxID=182062 RepID=A0A8H5FN25_9AGAR|nr:hypothetical protein D9758_013367 [Tetrapyrgos nigripes]
MPATLIQPSSVSTTLYFFTPPPDGARAFNDISGVSGRQQKNWESEKHTVEIENVRGNENSVSLNTTGFQFFLNEPTKHKAFNNDEDIEKEYYPESAELIKKLTGASRVVFFDHTIRRRVEGETGRDPKKRQPVPQAHVDQTPLAARNRVLRHLPESESAELLNKRFQIINLWRPIAHAALDWPLALRDVWGGYNPGQKWKYLRGMTPDDIVLIKCHDSREDVARLTPHTAFEDPTTPPDALPRESIELRSLVFYDE